MEEHGIQSPHDKWSRVIKRAVELVLIALPVFATAYIGSAATIPNIPIWYEALNKPFFNPPNWVFAPVWTLLYLTMIGTCWRVVEKARGTPMLRPILAIFAVQLFFNGLWPVMFFGLHQTGWAIPVVLALDLSVYATVAAFMKVDRRAGFVLLPYAVWVSFASALNIAVFILNIPGA